MLPYRQGDVNFTVNAEAEDFPQAFTLLHGPPVFAIAFRINDAGLTARPFVV